MAGSALYERKVLQKVGFEFLNFPNGGSLQRERERERERKEGYKAKDISKGSSKQQVV